MEGLPLSLALKRRTQARSSTSEAALTAGAEAEAELVLEAMPLLGPQAVITSYVGPVIIRD